MSEEKKTELPTSPGQMPRMDINAECNFIRNAFYELSSMADEVEIQLEKSDHECECDDSDGEWVVSAWRSNKHFTAKHESIAKALWYVLQHLNAKDRTDWENRERKKREALSKLTDEERRLLRLS